MSASVVTSLRISSTIPLSFSQLFNCSVSNPSYSLCWHHAALILCLPIHSCADSIFLLCSLWYYSNMTIVFCCGLKLMLIIVQRSLTVLNFSFSFCVNICMSYNLSLPNQPFNTGTFYSSTDLNALVSRIFKTSFSKCIISQRSHHWSCGSGTREGNPVLWKMLMQVGASL